jgi:hypothetical protein
MVKRVLIFVAAVCALIGSFVLGTRMSSVEGQAKTGVGFAAIPGQIGGQDPFGPYDAAENWPKAISDLPGNQKWTWGSGEGIFAESPNRVFILQRGELPNIPRPRGVELPQLGPNITFPIGRLPWRDATTASPPGQLDLNAPCGGAGQAECINAEVDTDGSGIQGRDFLWQNCLVVVDANGNITERWNQYDKDYRRPHSVFINPYDATKAVWVVDDYRHAIFKYTNDGSKLLQTIGTVNKHASDSTHFNRPTFMAWQPDSSFYVADGYNNTRVVKFDKDGKYLLAWGERGEAGGKEMRGGYFNTPHGVTVDQKTHEVFVNDRNNHRIQVFDANGKFLRQWSTGAPPSDVHLVYMGADEKVWIFDRGTSKMVQYDTQGHLLYAWGTWGAPDMPGAFWGVHGVSVDQDGNFYSAAVDSAGGQKFVPRKGANPAMMVGKPVKAAW